MDGHATTLVHIDADGTRTIAVIGELDLATAPTIERKLAEVSDAHPNVHVDVTAVEFVDAAGLRVLVGAVSRARQLGRHLEVTRPLPHSLRRLIALTRVGPQLGL
jgi:anti-sigma B factor antagonist